jgi:hypothetical protein
LKLNVVDCASHVEHLIASAENRTKSGNYKTWKPDELENDFLHETEADMAVKERKLMEKFREEARLLKKGKLRSEEESVRLRRGARTRKEFNEFERDNFKSKMR